MASSLLLQAAIVMACSPQGTIASADSNLASQWRAAHQHRVDLSTELPVMLALKRRNTDTLDSLFWSTSDPKSAAYGDRLGHAALRALLSPGAEALTAVKTWLMQHGGITEGQITVSGHEDYVRVRASVEQLERLFGVRFQVYEHTGHGRLLTRTRDSVSLHESVADVIELVSGISDLPTHKTKISPKAPKECGYNPQRVVTPEVLYNAYNMTGHFPDPIPNTRNMQSFFQYGQHTNNKDLATFCHKYLDGVPLTHGCNVSHFVGNNTVSDGDGESNLDAQYIVATSRGAETWSYSLDADSVNFCGSFLGLATDIFQDESKPHPWVVSMSYGLQSNFESIPCTPAEIKRVEEDFRRIGLQGVSLIIASGDSGSDYDDPSRTGFHGQLLYPSWPASSPYVTAVGATGFVNKTGTDYTQKAAYGWTEENPLKGWSGGGFAYSVLAPDYQKEHIEAYMKNDELPPPLCWASQGGAHRGTPDVSVVGWNYQVYYQGHCSWTGGTSAATPAFAGMVTQLNWVRMKDNGNTLGFLNQLLYAHPEVFTDVKLGTNDFAVNGFGFPSVEGWDAATGLGVPNFGMMVAMVNKQNGKTRGSDEGGLPQLVVVTEKKQSKAVMSTGAATIPIAANESWFTSADGNLLVVANKDTSDVVLYDSMSLKSVFKVPGTTCGKSGCSWYPVADDESSSKKFFAFAGHGLKVIESTGGSISDEFRIVDAFTFDPHTLQKSASPSQFVTGTDSMHSSRIACNAEQDTLNIAHVQCFDVLSGTQTVNYSSPTLPADGHGSIILKYSADATGRNVAVTAFQHHANAWELWMTYRTVTSSGCDIKYTNKNHYADAPRAFLMTSDFIFTDFVVEDLWSLKSCEKTDFVQGDSGDVRIVKTAEEFVFVVDKVTAASAEAGWRLRVYGSESLTSGQPVAQHIFPISERYENVDPLMYWYQASKTKSTSLLTMQGHQYMVEMMASGSLTISDLGQIPIYTASGPFGTIIPRTFAMTINDGRSLVIPNPQGFNVIDETTKKVTSTYQDIPLAEARQGPNRDYIIYQELGVGHVVVSKMVD